MAYEFIKFKEDSERKWSRKQNDLKLYTYIVIVPNAMSDKNILVTDTLMENKNRMYVITQRIFPGQCPYH
jgi:hypothetical protein